MADGVPYSVPREPGRWRAITLAAIVHAALLALLWFGVSWQNETPVAVEAEVWSPQTREAAPRPLPEPEPPAPVPVPVPVPAPREIVKPPAPEAPVEDPQIALEQQKKRKQQARREQEQAKAELKRKQAAEQAREDKQEKLAQQKLQQKRDEQLKLQQQADALAKQKTATDQKKLIAEKQRKDLLEAQKVNASRDEQIAQLRRAAGTPSTATGSGGSGDAPKSQGSRADASYIDRVRQKIKSNTIFNGADELSSNPAVEFAVELLPDGSARRVRKIKSSGVPGFDEAVERAIEKSQPFPPDKSGSAPSGFTVSYKPKDQ